MPESVALATIEASRKSLGNPSSMHWAGREARRLLDDARDCLADFLGVEPGSIVFTSGGSESNNLAIAGHLLRVAKNAQKQKVITTAIEHPSVLKTLEFWCDQLDFDLLTISPRENGVVDASDIIRKLDDATAMVCMMWANNETGIIQPAAEIVSACRTRNIPVLIDAVQLLGKAPMDLAKLDADFVSLSAHKIGGPKGVGCLVVRRGSTLLPWLLGGGQERGRRSGTENVAGAVGFAHALGCKDFSQCVSVRDYFESELLKYMPDVTVYGQAVQRVGNTSMFAVPGMDGETLLMQLDLAGFAVASGSACSSGKREPSHVLQAMGVDVRLARSSLRVSFGPEHQNVDADALVRELLRIRMLLRKMAGL